MIKKLDWKRTVEDDEDFLLFLCHLKFDVKMLYTPSLDFNKYIDYHTKKRTFSEAAAEEYNKVWNDYIEINSSELDRYTLFNDMQAVYSKWFNNLDTPKKKIRFADAKTGEVFYFGEYIGEKPTLSVIYDSYNESEKIGYAVLSLDESYIKLYDNIKKESIKCWPLPKHTCGYDIYFFNESDLKSKGK